MNELSSTIPDALGSIGNLQELYLAHNSLTGPIPTVLQNLTLSKLDLSFNNLQGEVPKQGVFRNLSHSSIAGNSKPCSGMPQLHLAPCPMRPMRRNRKGWPKYLIIALAITGQILFLIPLLAFIWLLYKKKLKRRQKGKLPPLAIEDQYERISYYELLKGTDGFSEANLIGRGSHGAVYKCTLQNENTSATAAVKVFNLQLSGSSRSFVAECEALRRVCLIKIITCCSSINTQCQDFKALVFEFMPHGSLEDWLHLKSAKPAPSNTLSLAQRLDIAVDVVDALEYLHNHCLPPIMHCDLKPGNILLAEDMSARVGDFGISRILSENANIPLPNSFSTIGIRGSISHVAPEYGEGCAVSASGDVYSFGILLLEMFTGRSPTDGMFIDSLDLHKFAEIAIPDRAMDIADPTIWLHKEATGMDAANASMVGNKIEECLVSVVGLAVSCSKQQPRERMLMRDAAAEMHAIRDAQLRFTG